MQSFGNLVRLTENFCLKWSHLTLTARFIGPRRYVGSRERRVRECFVAYEHTDDVSLDRFLHQLGEMGFYSFVLCSKHTHAEVHVMAYRPPLARPELLLVHKLLLQFNIISGRSAYSRP
jgi:hypothetical protein